MKQADFKMALQELVEAGATAVAEHRSLKRASCPSPVRFYIAYPRGWTSAEAAHIETCPYCQESLKLVGSLADSPAHKILASARLSWNEIRKTLEVTFDEARHLVSADSPFGGGFQEAYPGGILGGDDEVPVAYASTREGDELSIVVKGGRVTARFDGDSPPPLRLEAEGGAKNVPETREITWEKARRGWQADLGDVSKVNGLLTVEAEQQE